MVILGAGLLGCLLQCRLHCLLLWEAGTALLQVLLLLLPWDTPAWRELLLWGPLHHWNHLLLLLLLVLL